MKAVWECSSDFVGAASSLDQVVETIKIIIHKAEGFNNVTNNAGGKSGNCNESDNHPVENTEKVRNGGTLF